MLLESILITFRSLVTGQVMCIKLLTYSQDYTSEDYKKLLKKIDRYLLPLMYVHPSLPGLLANGY